MARRLGRHHVVATDRRAFAGAIGFFGGYEATYGSLAGVMVALLFFFVPDSASLLVQNSTLP